MTKTIQILASTFAVALVGCAQQAAPPPGPAVTGGYTYDRYARSAEVWGIPKPALQELDHRATAEAPPESLRNGSINPDA